MRVNMKRTGAITLTLFGTSLILLGLLFLVGSGGQQRRLIVAGLGLGLGAIGTGFGVRAFKMADAASPEQLRAEILDLARKKNGEVGFNEISAALGRRINSGQRVLEDLVTEGVCRRGREEGREYYVFPEMQPRLMARYCQYCDAEFPISDEREDCPNCGGTLETKAAAHSVTEGSVFSMD